MREAAIKPADFDIESVRGDFPILSRTVHDKPLVYFDNAASGQRPQAVIDAVGHFYSQINANVHRGVHTLSGEATDAFENARETMRGFLNAASTREIIFVRGSTEAINLVANTFGRANVGAGDEILITHMEHHSNIVPWQMLCEEKGAHLKVVPVDDQGEIDQQAFKRMLSLKVKLFAVVHVSNALGTINPIKEMIKTAHAAGVPVLVDGAQGTPHQAVDVQELGCDFYSVSGHKMYGPTGIGVLYGKESILEAMPPFQGGGEMIQHVSFEKTIYNGLPAKFEAGTPNIAGSIGLGAAARYLQQLGIENIANREAELLAYAVDAVSTIDEFRTVGTAKHKTAVISFLVGDIHPHDMGTILDHEGIAIRTGHHCTMPLMARFGVPGTARASMAFYNTFEEIDRFVAAVKRAQIMFA